MVTSICTARITLEHLPMLVTWSVAGVVASCTICRQKQVVSAEPNIMMGGMLMVEEFHRTDLPWRLVRAVELGGQIRGQAARAGEEGLGDRRRDRARRVMGSLLFWARILNWSMRKEMPLSAAA